MDWARQAQRGRRDRAMRPLRCHSPGLELCARRTATHKVLGSAVGPRYDARPHVLRTQTINRSFRHPRASVARWTAVYNRQDLACISHHLTAEARNRPAITALRLLAVPGAMPGDRHLEKQSASGAGPTSARGRRFGRGWSSGACPLGVPALSKKCGAERRAPCTDGPLTPFASPRGEKCRLAD